MKVFITGGAGFIGKWIVEKLPDDIEIIILDSLDTQAHPHQHKFPHFLKKKALCIKSDVRDIINYTNDLEGSDIIIHLASQTGTGQSMYEISRYVQHNVDGTAKLIEAISLLKKKPKRIILTSSRAVYGEGAYQDKSEIFYPDSRKTEDLYKGIWDIFNKDGTKLLPLPMHESHKLTPVSVYGFTKLWQEQLIQNFGQTSQIDFLILRLQNVYGPKQELNNPYTNILSVFTNSICLKNEVELFEDGNMIRDFVYVEDVADIIIKSIYYEKTFLKTINLGSGVPTSLIELVHTIGHHLNKKPHIKFSGRFRLGDIRNAVANIDCLRNIFDNWSPTAITKGMQQYVQWYTKQEHVLHSNVEPTLVEMQQRGFLKLRK